MNKCVNKNTGDEIILGPYIHDAEINPSEHPDHRLPRTRPPIAMR